MRNLIFFAFRNFTRQKRRNLLLGSAIAFGIMVLTVANSFSKGITDNIFNRIVMYMNGHIRINSIEDGRYMPPVIRDKERALQLVKSNITGIKEIQEDVGVFCRAIGNGKGDYVYMVGLTLDDSFTGQFQLKEGQWENFSNGHFTNPVLISEQKATYLKIKVGDPLRIRLTNVNGQQEVGNLTVAGILKSQNVWMDYASFVPLNDLKRLVGYEPGETGALKIILHDPKTAIEKTDKLHHAFKPGPGNDWILMPRSHNSNEFAEKMKDMMRNKYAKPVIDISSMYEMASIILKMEMVMNGITLAVALILFFIIMVGVLNSLRMTIHERTQEIGMMRAIGMKRSDVLWVFILEVLILAICGWIGGVVAAFIIMKALWLIQFSADNPLNMLMIDRRLYFLPTIGSTLKNLAFLLVFALITAYFPARKAAQLDPAQAFRHVTN